MSIVASAGPGPPTQGKFRARRIVRQGDVERVMLALKMVLAGEKVQQGPPWTTEHRFGSFVNHVGCAMRLRSACLVIFSRAPFSNAIEHRRPSPSLVAVTFPLFAAPPAIVALAAVLSYTTERISVKLGEALDCLRIAIVGSAVDLNLSIAARPG